MAATYHFFFFFFAIEKKKEEKNSYKNGAWYTGRRLEDFQMYVSF